MFRKIRKERFLAKYLGKHKIFILCLRSSSGSFAALLLRVFAAKKASNQSRNKNAVRIFI